MYARRSVPVLLEHLGRPAGQVHLAPLADGADIDELQTRLTVQVLAQVGDEPLLDAEVAIIPEHGIDLLLRVEPLVGDGRHAFVENPFRRDVLVLRVHVLRHEAEGDAAMPAFDPQIEDRAEVLMEAIRPFRVRFQDRPVLAEVADLDQRRKPGIGRQFAGVERSIEVKAHARVDQGRRRCRRHDLLHWQEGIGRRRGPPHLPGTDARQPGDEQWQAPSKDWHRCGGRGNGSVLHA